MSMIIDGTSGATFPDSSVQAKAGLVSGGTIASGTITALSTNGVSFPATQVPSSDPNTLDDYEEGTWTPVIDSEVAGTGRITSVSGARYTKIGNFVQAQCFINMNTLGSGGSGVWVINGLPFTVASSSAYTAGSIAYVTNLNSTVVSIGCYADAGFARLKVTGLASANANVGELAFSTYVKAGLSIIITITYQV